MLPEKKVKLCKSSFSHRLPPLHVLPICDKLGCTENNGVPMLFNDHKTEMFGQLEGSISVVPSLKTIMFAEGEVLLLSLIHRLVSPFGHIRQ